MDYLTEPQRQCNAITLQQAQLLIYVTSIKIIAKHCSNMTKPQAALAIDNTASKQLTTQNGRQLFMLK